MKNKTTNTPVTVAPARVGGRWVTRVRVEPWPPGIEPWLGSDGKPRNFALFGDPADTRERVWIPDDEPKAA
jgi:hypothetical protein